MSFDLGNGLELVRPWLLLAFNGGLLGIAGKLYIDNRRMRLAEKTRDQDFQLEVSADGRTNLQFVIDNLVAALRRQEEATAAQATAHDRCEEELRGVREQNRIQGKKIDGIASQFLAFSYSVGRAIPPDSRSPEITAMMEQLDALASAAGTTP